MTDEEMLGSFDKVLYADISPNPSPLPLLAHYTSLEALEKILASGEVWFSNPLFMNDLEEVRFGLLNGARVLQENLELADALGTAPRRERFHQALNGYQEDYGDKFLLDTYLFCLSEHEGEDRDGRLSMWRGYGGNGRGAAIVFDPSRLGPEIKGSSLIYAPVQYGTSEARVNWIRGLASKLAVTLTSMAPPDDKLHLAAFSVFERLKLFALFSKHSGFREEQEWRIVYMPERDQHGRLRSRLSYINGPRGVEPKLRLKVGPMEGMTSPDLSLEELIFAVLLGPTVSSPLSIRSVRRMLEVIGMPKLKNRLFASTIPFRAL
jgi:hypothetical protein